MAVSENKNDVSIEVMPNPTQNQITISTINGDIGSIEVISIYGQTIYKNSFSKSGSVTLATIDLSSYKTGIYFIRVDGTDFSVLKKIIKD